MCECTRTYTCGYHRDQLARAGVSAELREDLARALAENDADMDRAARVAEEG